MSGLKQEKRRDLSVFDKLSTEELEEILWQDSQLPADEEADMEAILYITEVLAEREKEQPVHHFKDPEAAWKEFNELYRPFVNDPRPLWADGEEASAVTPGAKTARPRAVRRTARTVGIAAIIVVFLFAGSLCAYALGYDLWGNLAQWTKETFRLAETGGEDGAVAPVLVGFEQLLAEYGVTAALPGYMPEGFREQVHTLEQEETA